VSDKLGMMWKEAVTHCPVQGTTVQFTWRSWGNPQKLSR